MLHFLINLLSAGQANQDLNRFKQMQSRLRTPVEDHAEFVRRRDVLVKVRTYAAGANTASGVDFVDSTRKRLPGLDDETIRRIYQR